MARVDDSIKQVLLNLRLSGAKDFPRTDEILTTMDGVQLELAQRGLAIKGDIPFHTEAGVDTYDLGVKILKIKQFFRPLTWLCDVEVITNTEDWDDAIRKNSGITSQPLYLTVWNQRLKFYRAPSVTGEEGSLFLYYLPSKNLDEDMNPEVGIVWDNALELGTTAQFAGGDWGERYEKELARLGHQEMREIGQQRIKSQFDVGF